MASLCVSLIWHQYGLMWACGDAHQAPVAQVAIDEGRLACIDGDNGLCLAYLAGRALATGLAPIVVNVWDLEWRRMVNHAHPGSDPPRSLPLRQRRRQSPPGGNRDSVRLLLQRPLARWCVGEHR
jgi:hypothetical protein